MQHKLINTVDYLLIVDDSEIKEGDYYLFTWGGKQEIQRFKDQESDRQNHEYLYRTACKKIIAYLPLNNSPILEGVDLLPDLPQFEDDIYDTNIQVVGSDKVTTIKEFLKKHNKEVKEYTEEDLRKAFKYGIEMEAGIESFDYKNYPDGFSQFIDSLNKQD